MDLAPVYSVFDKPPMSSYGFSDYTISDCVTGLTDGQFRYSLIFFCL